MVPVPVTFARRPPVLAAGAPLVPAPPVQTVSVNVVLGWLRQHKIIVALVCFAAGGLGVRYLSSSGAWSKKKKGDGKANAKADDSIAGGEANNTIVALSSAHEFLELWRKSFRSDPEMATFPVETAYETFRHYGAVESEQLCAGILAICSHRLGETDQARKYGLSWYRAYKNTKAYPEDGGEIMCILGECFNRANKFSDAEKALTIGAGLARQQGPGGDLCLKSLLKQLGDTQLATGNFDACISTCEECLAVIKRAGTTDPADQSTELLRGNALRTLGSAYSAKGRHAEAFAALKESMNVFLQLPHEKASYARAVGDYGSAIAKRNLNDDASTALQVLQRAEAASTAASDNVAVATCLSRIARLALDRHRAAAPAGPLPPRTKSHGGSDHLPQCLTLLRKALDLLGSVVGGGTGSGGTHGVAVRVEMEALICLGEAMLASGCPQDALPQFRRARDIAKASGAKGMEAIAQDLFDRTTAGGPEAGRP